MAKFIILVSAFITPLIFNFSTRELFEFPKMIFVYLVSTSAFGHLLNHLRKLPISRIDGNKPILLALAFFLLANIVSTTLSINITTSVFGYYTRFNGGLLSLLSYLTLFCLCLFYLLPRDVLEVVFYLILGSLAVSFYAILQHFGIDKNFWVQDSQARAFSTLGQPNWLAAYLLMVLPIPIFFLLNEISTKKRFFYLFSVIVNFSAIWFTYSLSGLVGLAFIVLALPAAMGKTLLRKNLAALVFLAFSCLTIALIQPGIFATKVSSVYKTLTERSTALAAERVSPPTKTAPIDTSFIRLVVWQGAFNLFLSSPKVTLVGTGPETFAYSFLRFRPKALNQTTEWDFLYNKAHNYYFDLATGIGTLGLLSYLWLIRSVFRLRRNHPLSATLMVGWLTLPITNFFGWPTVSTSLLFFLFPAFLIVINSKDKELRETVIYNRAADRILKILVIPSLFIGFYFAINTFIADVRFAQAITLSKRGFFEEANSEFKKSINSNPLEPTYRREYAFNLVQQSLISEDGRSNSVSETILQSEAAFRLNPLNSLTLKSLLRTYYALAKLDPLFEKNVEEYAQKTTHLSPTEPRAFYDSALIFSYLGKNDDSRNYAQKALTLKPDYEEAAALLRELTEKVE